jgi:acetoin utilization deacetylase AcuC-like enzyme
MIPLILYHSNEYPIELPPGHKFPAAKYVLVRSLLEPEGGFRIQPAPFVSESDLALAHDPAYVRTVLDGSVDPRVMRRIGFPWSPDLVRRSLASAGGTLAAARDAIRTGFGGNLAGGTHHAFRDSGAGFCVFNDLAVAVHVLRREGQAQRAAILDLDVHQGDGTAAIFEHDGDVLTISVHGQHNFPFRKQRSRIDVGLPDGAGDAEYLDEIRRILPEMLMFRPEIVLYQSGVDGLAADRLGRLSLTASGLAERDRLVFASAKQAGIPLAVALGGGYAEPIELSVECHAQTYRIARQFWGD